MMNTTSTVMIALMMSVFAIAPSHAGSQAFNCADASGQLTYDGQQLSYRNTESADKFVDVKSKKVSETLLSTIEEVCINKAGQKFVAGSKTSLLVLEYPQSYDQKLVQSHFLCVEEYDSYPNADGVDTKCVKTSTKAGRLRDTTLVTEMPKK